MGSFSGIVVISIQFVIFINATYYVYVLKKLRGYGPSQSAIHLACYSYLIFVYNRATISLCWTLQNRYSY
jgi:hypothetical protein